MSTRAFKTLNYAAGGIQLVLCAFLVTWFYTIDTESKTTSIDPDTGEIISGLAFPVGEYNQPLGTGKDHGTVSVSTIVALLAVFTGITALVHVFVYARSSDWYQTSIERGSNWVRWVEYSITATIMLFVIAVTCGVNSTDVLLLVCVATLCCMICGYMSETTATGTQKGVSIAATIMGWLLLISVFSVIIRRFSSIIGQTQGTDSSPPDWVWITVVALTMLFMVFGVIHLVHMWKQWTTGASVSFNLRIEASYTVASMVSKTLLVSLLASGLFLRT